MIHLMYSSSEMTGSMFDVAVLIRLVLRCARCCVIYMNTHPGYPSVRAVLKNILTYGAAESHLSPVPPSKCDFLRLKFEVVPMLT
jgi:hypothetical protein